MPSGSVSYRTLFSLPGRTFVTVAALARLPLAMSQLGTLLLVSSPQVSGRLGPGGLAAGMVALAIAAGSPFFGALTDRYGQRTVLLVQSLIGGAVLIAEGLAALAGASWPVVAAIGGLAGFFLPQIGTMARVRWRAIGAENPAIEAGILETSFAWEGAVDEASFALGPAAVGVLAVLAGPIPGLIVAGAMLLVLGSWFAVDPTSRLVPGRRQEGTTTRSRQGRNIPGPLFTAGVVATSVGMVFMGMVFGSVQTGTTSLATQAGRPGLAGLFHALLSVGSAAAGLALPRLAHHLGLATRWRLFAAGLAVFAVPLLLVDRLGPLAPVLIILGMAAAPYMITLFSVAERSASPGRIGTVMTLLAATNSLGYAFGTTLAGRLADWGGPTPAYGVTVGVGVAATLLALPVARRVASTRD
ncbi:MFS transporter [Cutibacterium sp. WCA-380-WT-3A]|uniref:MFS transporter n=1 Tax=Cutibacterium porci TaxID=2605781 RepID=A0A7K0J8X7_9ACTN|nr:MFS transporter [Cutibacterium porci]MSS46208.1 MFS transporter [Cutibacterium porci]